MPNEVAEHTSSSNPFAGAQIATRPSNAVAENEQQRAIAETQAAMIIAKRFPRNQIEAMDRILQAFTRPTLAEHALYSYSRGGSDITGPSIRSAEAIAQGWGNIQYGIRELDQRNGESAVEAFAWDIETNTRRTMQFQVKHERHTKKGTYRLEDPRDIYEMVANQGARRVRACILGVVPGDVVEAAVKQAETTLATRAEVTPERLQSLLEKFSAYGVTKEQIETRIQRRLDAMTPALLVQLGKVYNSLKDGMSTPGDWFEMPERPTAPSASASDALKDKLRGKKPAAKASTDPETGEIKDERTGDAPTAEAPTMADVMRLISETDYDGAQDLANTIGGNAPTEAANAIAKHKKGNK